MQLGGEVCIEKGSKNMLQDVNATYPKVRDLAASGNVAAFNSALCDAVAMELTISMLAKGEAALVEDVK